MKTCTLKLPIAHGVTYREKYLSNFLSHLCDLLICQAFQYKPMTADYCSLFKEITQHIFDCTKKDCYIKIQDQYGSIVFEIGGISSLSFPEQTMKNGRTKTTDFGKNFERIKNLANTSDIFFERVEARLGIHYKVILPKHSSKKISTPYLKSIWENSRFTVSKVWRTESQQ